MCAERQLELTGNSRKVLRKRYLLRDHNGRVAETPEELFSRVARTVAEVDSSYDPSLPSGKRESAYYDMLSGLRFLPNSPTLMNAGTRMGQLSACFVIPVGDSMKQIFRAVSVMADIHKSGGGTGFSFSRLRPKNDIVAATGGVASGPVSFMKIFDQATEVIKQGGRRRGANMGILRVDHPDIMEFITAKTREGVLKNFNLSVAVTDAFMERLAADDDYPLINPRSKKAVGSLNARDVWQSIAASAWKTGEPGVIFIDRINRMHPVSHTGEIEATNPCGEQPLLPFESCNLGSINLKTVIRNGSVDYDLLRLLVGEAVQFLDGVIDANKYPLAEIERITKANRKIGLGVMGLAEMLIMAGLPYASERALRTAESVMRTIHEEAVRKSAELGRARGSFPNFRGSQWEKRGLDAMRNATVTTIAPTGTVSIIAGASSGIEPLFAVSYMRRGMDGTELPEVSPLFVRRAKAEGWYSGELMKEIARRGSLQQIPAVPGEVRELFLTAGDIEPSWHVRMQAVFQKYTDNAVSKTINLPAGASPEDIERVYSMAFDHGCKGITVFRYGSRAEQVLSIDDPTGMTTHDGVVTVSDEFVGECKICSV